MDHVGWKWWKAQQPDRAQAHIELVDIWHFLLSKYIQHHADLNSAAMQLEYQMRDPGRLVHTYGHRLVNATELDTHQQIDLMGGLAAQDYDCAAVFGVVCGALGLSWDELRRIYVAKNVLNIFRQSNGYKDGSYVKEWGGLEDNVYLERLMNAVPNASPDELMDALAKTYADVRAAAAA